MTRVTPQKMSQEKLLRRILKAKRQKSTTLDLSKSSISELPEEIGQLTNLTTLYLAGNELSSLPPEISKLTNLNRLSLENNELTKIPSQLFDLNMKVKFGAASGMDLENNPLGSSFGAISAIKPRNVLVIFSSVICSSSSRVK
jgi:Leucine-rich repeat (LRR) protein